MEVVVDPADVRAAADWAQREGRWGDVARLVFAAVPVLGDRAEDARDMLVRTFAELGESEIRARFLAVQAWYELSALIADWPGVADCARAAASQPDPACQALATIIRALLYVAGDPERGLELLDGTEDLAGRVEDPITRDELLCYIVAFRGWMLCRTGRLSEGVHSLEAAIALGSRSEREPEPLATVELSLVCGHVALGDPTTAVAIAHGMRVRSRFVDENLPLALALLAAGDVEHALARVQTHTARAVTGRLAQEANDSLLLLSMLARAEGDDDLARRLLPEVGFARTPGPMFVSDHLADVLGVRTELDEARGEVLDDRKESSRKALVALRSEIDRRGWSA